MSLDDERDAALQCIDNGNLEKGLAMLKKLSVKYEKCGDKRNLSDSSNMIGGILSGLGKYDEAIEYFKKSIAILHKLGFKTQEGVVKLQLAETALESGNSELALEYARMARDIFDSLDELYLIGVTDNFIGVIKKETKKLADAMEYFESAERIFDDIKNELNEEDDSLLILYENMAYCYRDIGDTENAKHYMELAISENKRFGNEDAIQELTAELRRL